MKHADRKESRERAKTLRYYVFVYFGKTNEVVRLKCNTIKDEAIRFAEIYLENHPKMDKSDVWIEEVKLYSKIDFYPDESVGV